MDYHAGSFPLHTKFKLGDKVDKISGSKWTGHIVGVYGTSLTHEGYAVESTFHPGSVQIYPASALRLVERVGKELEKAASKLEKKINDVCASRNHRELALGWLRYEALRKLRSDQFRDVCYRNVHGERFDDMADVLIECDI